MRKCRTVPQCLAVVVLLSTISVCHGDNHIASVSMAAVVSKAAPSIQWEVIHRFRVMDDERSFYSDLSTFLPRAKKIVPFLSLARKRTNYETHWLSRQGIYDARWLHDSIRIVRFSIDGVPASTSCRWQIDERPLPDRHCRDVETTINIKSAVPTVRVWLNTTSDPISSPIMIEDIWIVGLGDSYGSGEGNPHIGFKPGRQATSRGKRVNGVPAVWWDSRCHRSLLSGQALAAAQIALRNRHASVTFLSFACSGAKIDKGMLNQWSGIENSAQVLNSYMHWGFADRDIPDDQYPAPGDIPSQLDQMRKALTPPGSATPRRPDYILISVGGNDIGFGQIALNLLLPTGVQPPLNGCTGLPRAVDCYKKREILDERFVALLSKYGDLYTKLNDIGFRYLILTEYPNLVKDMDGEYCSDKFSERGSSRFKCPGSLIRSFSPLFGLPAHGAGLDRTEAEFVDNGIIRKLNETGRASIERAGKEFPAVDWRYAEGIYQSSSDNGGGYCSCNPWFLTILDSTFGQGEPGKDGKWWAFTTGVAHPNAIGQCHYADEILSATEWKGGGEVCDGTSWEPAK